jgi:hypothetical protein
MVVEENQRTLKREKLSIRLLGQKRFYIGSSVGLVFAILGYLFFGSFREIPRGQTLDSDLIILTDQELVIYNLFFAAVSVTIGFGVTVWFWFNAISSSQVSRRRANYISAYSMFWSMTLLYVVSRTGSYMTWILFDIDGYDDHLNLSQEMPLLLFLLPTVFFLNIWTPIRLSYRCGNWFLKSLALFVTVSGILSLYSPVDQSVMNELWSKDMAPYDKIVDTELEKAHAKGIKFSSLAIETVKFNKRERLLIQAKELKNRFKSETPIPIDSVVLELILIKKSTVRFLNTEDWDKKTNLWPFALPRNIYRQIEMSNDSIKNNYLKAILAEYESIFKDDWDSWEEARDSGLSEKYAVRHWMQYWYSEIYLEVVHFKDKLKESR